VAAVLPLLYLHGLATGNFVPALEAFFGSPAGLSAAAIGRLLAAWQTDYQAFCQRDLSDRDYVYVWADGLHFRVRLERARVCCLVVVGVRADGTKELVAVADGERESTDSWAELLRDLRRRGMRAGGGGRRRRAGAVGGAPRRLPQTRHQRDWVHQLANVLGCLRVTSPCPRLIGGDRRRRRRGPQVRQECGQADASIARSTPSGAAARLPEGPVGTVALCLPCYSR
jgi:putative transposase